jgi:hypothetical protein
MLGARIRQERLALSGAAQAGGALGGTFDALIAVPMTLPDFLMTGAPKAGTTALPGLTANPREDRQGDLDAELADVDVRRSHAALATVAPGNPGYADVVPHSGRHRPGFTPDHPPCEEIEQRLATLSAIATPGGMADGNFPATDRQPRQAPPHSRGSS